MSDKEVTPVAIVHSPKVDQVPIVASIPHSGIYVPETIATLFTEQNLKWLRNTDWFLPEVFDFLPELGITTIEATHSRYVIDLNRSVSADLYGSFGRSAVASNYASGEPTHKEPPTNEDLQSRVHLYHEPYHLTLAEIINHTVSRFGTCLLLDIHSFMGPSDDDICLGNLKGASCDPKTIERLREMCVDEGFVTEINQPFSGAYILRKHHNEKTEAIQLELRYTNYLDCTKIDTPSRPQFDVGRINKVKPRLRRVIENLIKIKIKRLSDNDNK